MHLTSLTEVALIMLITSTISGLEDPSRGVVDLRGQVIKVTRSAQKEADPVLGTILVDGFTTDLRRTKAIVRVNKETKLFKIEKGQLREASFKALKARLSVEIRFSGPVRESYPVKATAAEVLILD